MTLMRKMMDAALGRYSGNYKTIKGLGENDNLRDNMTATELRIVMIAEFKLKQLIDEHRVRLAKEFEDKFDKEYDKKLIENYVREKFTLKVHGKLAEAAGSYAKFKLKEHEAIFNEEVISKFNAKTGIKWQIAKLSGEVVSPRDWAKPAARTSVKTKKQNGGGGGKRSREEVPTNYLFNPLA